MFHFGEKTGVELRGEKDGLVPSKAYYERRYGKGGATAGMMANIAIGQGELLTTPLQMAQFAMILANSGKYYQLHLFKEMVDKLSGDKERPKIIEGKINDIKPEVFETVREGMRQVVAGGTGWRASVWRMTGAGKPEQRKIRMENRMPGLSDLHHLRTRKLPSPLFWKMVVLAAGWQRRLSGNICDDIFIIRANSVTKKKNRFL